MTTDVAREEARSHRRNFEQDKASDKAEHQKTRHHSDESSRIVNEGGSACQIRDHQMAHNTHRRCGDNLVKLASDKDLERSPEKEVGLIEYHPRYEHGSKNADDCRTNCSIGDDYAN